MAPVINLRQARKTRARDDARRKGDENAAKFGRTRAQKTAEEADAARAASHLDRHRRDDGGGDD